MVKQLNTQNLWSIPCKKTIVDDQTKLISIIDIIERVIFNIDINKAPAEWKDLYKNGSFSEPVNLQDEIIIASYWSIGTKEKGKDMILITEIEDSEKKKLSEGKLEFKTEKDSTNHRTFVKFPFFPITKSGAYTITSSLKNQSNKTVAESTLQIMVDINFVNMK